MCRNASSRATAQFTLFYFGSCHMPFGGIQHITAVRLKSGNSSFGDFYLLIYLFILRECTYYKISMVQNICVLLSLLLFTIIIISGSSCSSSSIRVISITLGPMKSVQNFKFKKCMAVNQKIIVIFLSSEKLTFKRYNIFF